MWLAVSALSRLAPPSQWTWFPLQNLLSSNFIFSSAISPIYGLVLLAYVFLLRVSEASSLLPADLGPGRLGLHAAKRDRTVCWRPVTPFIDGWLVFLRQYYTTQSLPTASALNRHLRALFPGQTLTWHAMRCGGAATLVQLGTTPEQLTSWGTLELSPVYTILL